MLRSPICALSASLLAAALAACSPNSSNPTDLKEARAAEMPEMNPLLTPSPLHLEYPPFDRIDPAHFLPAFEVSMAEQLAEIDNITAQAEAPTFENTLVQLELAGQTLNRVASVFFGLASAHTNDALKGIEAEIAPKLAEHQDRIFLNAALFGRIQAVYGARDRFELGPESLRLVEETHRAFVRAGAKLSAAEKESLRAINAELAKLQTRFSQNVLNEVNDSFLVVHSQEELSGLSDAQIETAASEAESRGMDGRFVIPLLNTTQQPLLSELENREMRERLLKRSMERGSRGGDYDNREIVSRTAELRARRAQLLGFVNHADYVLDDETAGAPVAVNKRLASLTPAAVANAKREADELQTIVDNTGGGFKLAAWDWDFYAEKLRRERYAFDESQLRPYLELESVLFNGVFFAASQVYGIAFKERFDLPVYHEDVRVFDVFDHDGSTLGLFVFDAYARESKRGGAWMSHYVTQSHLLGKRPVVANHLNIPEPTQGEPTLLTFTEVITAFHEFGHALHGLFSDVNYIAFGGTRVPRDFVEFPSQLNEMWATWPAVLANYAKHHETGEPMPKDLLDRVLAAERFNQGYATTEYLAASLIDQALHQLAPGEAPAAEDILTFEAEALAAAGASLATVPPRYRLPYFSHIMGGYSAGYYAYIWSEVLDADTEQWFRENGGMTRANGQHFRDTLLSRGGSEDAMTLFRAFAGREPSIEPLLERRGLN
ncbi:MAG: M3 family metallopeptidase [Gammaproteobacteria bacterium]|nr:M3 family metallopeptidase [Gammaproteobacteria bacterium]MYK81599.1 M3 family metallopeptidase [Gammaproteobacteria bacterium]